MAFSRLWFYIKQKAKTSLNKNIICISYHFGSQQNSVITKITRQSLNGKYPISHKTLWGKIYTLKAWRRLSQANTFDVGRPEQDRPLSAGENQGVLLSADLAP